MNLNRCSSSKSTSKTIFQIQSGIIANWEICIGLYFCPVLATCHLRSDTWTALTLRAYDARVCCVTNVLTRWRPTAYWRWSGMVFSGQSIGTALAPSHTSTAWCCPSGQLPPPHHHQPQVWCCCVRGTLWTSAPGMQTANFNSKYFFTKTGTFNNNSRRIL